MNKTIKKRTTKKNKTKKIYSKKHYNSGDGMLTTVWGPSMWHYLHIMSFNYPVKPSSQEKMHYKNFMLNLQYVLPCRHCRENLTNNYKAYPIKECHLKSRAAFSRYVYRLHEIINKMLGKKSGLKFCDVKERYEHFRSRCTEENPKIFEFKKKEKKEKKEKGCTEPLYGKKAKCVIKIVPYDEKCKTFQMDEKCVKNRD
jgi:hypothetical protein